jgi:dTDP-4-dehydrorhamnose reductase
MKSKTVVIGANGQLGADTVAALLRSGETTIGLTHADLEITSLHETREVLTSIQPSIVVNTAAMHNVESCEREPLKAYEVNALGVRNLSIVASELNAKFVHVSTDYVFDGSKRRPYVEEDSAVPLNVYGNTKLAGENFIRATADKYFILRTSALYGKTPCRAKGGKNFVDTMLRLARDRNEVRVVADEFVSPTFTADLAKQIVELSRTEHYGLYHATAEGSCSWHEFAQAIFDISNTKVNLKVAAPNEFPTKVPRPRYSVLENANLKRIGLNVLAEWRAGLMTYLAMSANLISA